jgi:hypothetical protein
VASSKTINFGFVYKAHTIPSLCLGPPLSFIPLSPCKISKASVKVSIYLSNLAIVTALFT